MAAVDFNAIKEHVTARDAAEYYGLTVNRYGMALCPFHEERHPSLKLDERFHCFGCGADGSVLDFVAQLFDLTLPDAARKLASDFGIMCSPSSRNTIQRLQRPQTLDRKNELKRLEEHYYSVLCDYFRRLHSWKEEYAPKSITEDLHPLFVEAVNNEDYIEYLLDILLSGSDAERAALLNEQVHTVSALEKRFSTDAMQKGA